uniref:hypothetical protein n=1 Tax=Catenuloplanes japonicus TaxID=33876 RepID=UPI000526D584
KVPAGIPQEDVPSYIRERVQSHVVNTVPLTVNPVGYTAENTVSTISGQQTSRSVILASGLGQPVHKFTIDM